jgi:hypothetical protein
VDQVAWNRALHKAAKCGFTVKQAVILWQKARHTTLWPMNVSPLPTRELARRKVVDLWPEFINPEWRKA